MTAKTDLRDLTCSGLAAYMEGLGLPASRARFVFAWLQRPGVRDFAQMADVSREIRATLAGHAVISSLTSAQKEESRDGTVKFAFTLQDGAVVESVLIPEKGRHTLCVSSQAGCAMGCRFCLTGAMGLRRNLRPAEIVGQVLAVLEHMLAAGVKRTTHRELINNLVFMGMGEPLANYDKLLAALRILMDGHGLEFTERRITVSTCGIAPRIRDLGRDVRVNLAVSLHAADDETRSRLMPVNRTWGVDELLAACRSFPLPGRKVILFEYILIKGINDAEADALRLAGKLRGIPCRINLLPFNECESLSYRCPEEQHILRFQKILRDAGYRTFIRSSRGADISAACGQLASRGSSHEQT
ncbi:MAG: 23S rRNA (adenine(2503)-C(2))-methyltransferase RlmN [Thermodesulfobacteriota bacterium]